MTIQQKAIALTIALVATLALPVAAAHWTAGSASPHEHVSVGPSTLTVLAYSTEAQRLCVNPSGPTITWSDPANGNCAPGEIPVSPLRGVPLGVNQCLDLDNPTSVVIAPRSNGLSAVTLDWGAGTLGPKTAFSDFFAHPDLSVSTPRLGHDYNPTGASVDFYPGYTATSPGVVQLSLTAVGVGTTSNPVVSGPLFPGVDQSDNDFETCSGGASHTYAIDSATDKWVAGPSPAFTLTPVLGVGAGYGLNDVASNGPIGGDGFYDATAASPLIDTGLSIPATSSPPLGVLLSPITVLAEIRYSLCNDIANAGCTNIPDAGSGVRYGNGAQLDSVYTSLQDCVWNTALAASPVTHGGSGNPYAGQAADWGTSNPNGFSCWPERLSRVSATPGTLYFPSTQATLTSGGVALWSGDKLPATPRGIESIAVFIDHAGDFPLHNFDSGCPQGSPVDPVASCFIPTMAPPAAWVQTPGSIETLNAVFQP